MFGHFFQFLDASPKYKTKCTGGAKNLNIDDAIKLVRELDRLGYENIKMELQKPRLPE